jgi:hypothetical protein
MVQSVLNNKKIRVPNRSLYFVLGLMSASQSLERRLEDASSNPAMAESTNEDQGFLYFSLGLLAFSQQLQNKLVAERDRIVSDAVTPATVADERRDALSNLLY